MYLKEVPQNKHKQHKTELNTWVNEAEFMQILHIGSMRTFL